jgi:hypothetical protein
MRNPPRATRSDGPRPTQRGPSTVAAPADLELIVFGDNCPPCADPDPCACGAKYGRDPEGHVLGCDCTCGRCLFDGPLSDDGPDWMRDAGE